MVSLKDAISHPMWKLQLSCILVNGHGLSFTMDNEEDKWVIAYYPLFQNE